MSYRIIHRNPRTMIFFSKIIIAALIGLVIYTKYFEDKVVAKFGDTATVIEVTKTKPNPELEHNVGSNSAFVHVKLDDGTQAKTFVGPFIPKVGATVDVTVQVYESGKKRISVDDAF